MKKFILCVGLVVLALVAPLIITNAYYLDGLITAYMWSMLVLGFALIFATGRIPLGHAGFMAIGAYFSAITVMRLGLSFWLALPLAGLVTGGISAMFALLVIRRSGLTFLMLTWAFAEIIRLIPANEESVLGGRIGIRAIPQPDSFSLFGLANINFVSKVPYYYLILFLLLLMLLFLWRFYSTRSGMTIRSISQGERRCKPIMPRRERVIEGNSKIRIPVTICIKSEDGPILHTSELYFGALHRNP